MSTKPRSVSKKKAPQKSQNHLDRLVELMKEYKQIDNEMFPQSLYAKMGDKKRTKPIILMFSADWHLGSRSCNHEQWLRDIRYWSSMPPEDVRLILVGDLIDNVSPRFKSAEAVFGYLRPEVQKEMLKVVLEELRPYLEIACWGNHDIEWDEKNIGYSDLAHMFGKKCVYFNGNGIFDYSVGKQTYKINLSHKMKGSSWFHALQSNIRGWLQTHADAVVTAHKHDWGYMTDCRGSDETGAPRDRHLLQIGTYKTESDTYSDRNFRQGVVHNDCLVLSHDEHKIMHFSTLEDAVKWTGIKPKK